MQCKTPAINQNNTHFSFPVLRATYSTEHSANLLCGPPCTVHPGTPGARVGTVYGAKRMIVYYMCKII